MPNSATNAEDSCQYWPIAELGEGGMGKVYLAVNSGAELAALKVLPPERREDRRFAMRFQREIEIAARFDHPHVVRSKETGTLGDAPFLAMEYVDGINLLQLVNCCGPLSVPDACEITRQAALGIAHIHESGVIHRDVKPSNAMLTGQGLVKIVDLGLAIAIDDQAAHDELESTEQLVGSFDYIAPEQAHDSRTVNAAVDLYGLGATLYQLLTGAPPFDGTEFNTPIKKLMAAVTCQAPCVRERRTDVPAELATIIARLLAKNPEERLASATELAQALANFVEGSDLVSLATSAAARREGADSTANEPAFSTSNCRSSLTVDFETPVV